MDGCGARHVARPRRARASEGEPELATLIAGGTPGGDDCAGWRCARAAIRREQPDPCDGPERARGGGGRRPSCEEGRGVTGDESHWSGAKATETGARISLHRAGPVVSWMHRPNEGPPRTRESDVRSGAAAADHGRGPSGRPGRGRLPRRGARGRHRDRPPRPHRPRAARLAPPGPRRRHPRRAPRARAHARHPRLAPHRRQAPHRGPRPRRAAHRRNGAPRLRLHDPGRRPAPPARPRPHRRDELGGRGGDALDPPRHQPLRPRRAGPRGHRRGRRRLGHPRPRRPRRRRRRPRHQRGLGGPRA